VCVCFGMFLVGSKSLVMADLMGGRVAEAPRRRKHQQLLYKLQSISLFFTIINIAQTTRASGCASTFSWIKNALRFTQRARGANLCKVQMKQHSVLATDRRIYCSAAGDDGASAWIRLYLFAHSHCSAISF
jgi:hypothetical protein